MTTATEPHFWEARRSAFRHDWLKNTYLNRLDGFLSGLDAANPDLEWLLEFVEEDLPAWEERKEEARQVIGTNDTTLVRRLRQPGRHSTM
jgi:glycerol kinase